MPQHLSWWVAQTSDQQIYLRRPGPLRARHLVQPPPSWEESPYWTPLDSSDSWILWTLRILPFGLLLLHLLHLHYLKNPKSPKNPKNPKNPGGVRNGLFHQGPFPASLGVTKFSG